MSLFDEVERSRVRCADGGWLSVTGDVRTVAGVDEPTVIVWCGQRIDVLEPITIAPGVELELPARWPGLKVSAEMNVELTVEQARAFAHRILNQLP